MKKVLIVLTLIISINITAIKNWKFYTNTTHIYDIEVFDDKIYFATWGGLLRYDPINENFEKTNTIIDGMGDNDIRTLNVFEQRNELLIGTSSAGIDRLANQQYILPLTEIMGLASNNVNEIVSIDSLIIAATNGGLSIFLDAPEFPYPLPINNYNIEDGLSANDITSLQISDDGYLFCGSNSGLDFVHIDSINVETAWSHFRSDNSVFPSSIINDVAVEGNLVAVGTREGLVVSEFPDFNWVAYQNDFFGNNISSVYPVYIDSNLDIYLGGGFWNEENLIVEDSTDIAVIKFKNEVFETWHYSAMNLSNTQIKGFKEINGDIYAYTWGEGFVHKENNIWTSPKKINSLLSNTIKNIVIDDNNILWVTDGHKGSMAMSNGTRGVSSFNGETWQNHTAEDTGLGSNNNYSICVDKLNRKWFGAWNGNAAQSWQGGITVFDDANSLWNSVTVANGIGNHTISYLTVDDDNRTWICSYGGENSEITILDENFNDISSFKFYSAHDSTDMDPNYVFFGEEKIFVGGWISGLRIWNDTSDPFTNGEHWSLTPFSDLQASRIFAIESRKEFNEEIWIASSTGLFMFDGIDWFKYGTTIKKKVWQNGWFWSESIPDPEYWYYEGQERLFGAQITYPTALFVDPFGIVWIGTEGAGITAFDVDKDTFTNYTTSNSSLISNSITDFAYNAANGVLYIGTIDGLNSAQIGIAANENTEKRLNKVLCYPNPFNPDKGDVLRIENLNAISMPEGKTKCRIYNLNGELIIDLEKDQYEQFSWEGTNKNNKKCSSGIYFYVIYTPDGQIAKGKFVLIR